MKKFEGTFVVMVTPFTQKEELDLDAYRKNIDFYIKNGVHGVIVGVALENLHHYQFKNTKK